MKIVDDMTSTYRGRFAPSPSGPLHFGSLVAALGSYLQAKANNGLWFVRIEDIDKPREQAGAVNQILDALEAFGMHWDKDSNTSQFLLPNDRDCLVQTHRLERYQQIFEQLCQQQHLYACECTRKQIKLAGGLYQGTCQNKQLAFDNQAIRLHIAEPVLEFEDLLFGKTRSNHDFASEDVIVKRRDGLFAYQLVVVIDDIDQGITEVVRGADILELTTRQLSLYNLLGAQQPSYLHLPLAVTKPGFKLSKQNHATGININDPTPELISALSFLGLPVEADLASASVNEIINWATSKWNINNIPKQTELLV